MAKKRLSSTSALVDGVLEKIHTFALVEALLEKIGFLIFLSKLPKKRLSSTSALVDGVLEKNHTSELVEAILERIGFLFTKYKVVPFGFFQILTKIQTEPFSGLTFLCFLGKKRYIFEYTLLYHVLS